MFLIRIDIENYVIECDEPPLPSAGIHYVSNSSLRQILFREKMRIDQIKKYALPKPMFESIPLPKGYTARVQLLMPPSWRPELRDAAFPVIVQV